MAQTSTLERLEHNLSARSVNHGRPPRAGRLDILILVDNELDPLSPCPTDLVQQSGGIKDIAMREQHPKQHQDLDNNSNVEFDLRMKNICHAAHGSSLLVSATKGDRKRTLLMDAGPEASVLEQNVRRLRADMSKVEYIYSTHWHADHSAGLLKAVDLIQRARKSKDRMGAPVPVDLHPKRPLRRGIQLPDMPLITMQADPTWEELQNDEALIHMCAEPHNVMDDSFLISGEIPRLTPYEKGLESAVAYNTHNRAW